MAVRIGLSALSAAWGQKTTAQQLGESARGRARARPARKRRGPKARAAVAARPRRARAAGKARLVKGSPAAKRRMAQLRGMRRRRK